MVLPVVRSFGQIGDMGGDQQCVNDISEFDDIPVTLGQIADQQAAG